MSVDGSTARRWWQRLLAFGAAAIAFGLLLSALALTALAIIAGRA